MFPSVYHVLTIKPKVQQQYFTENLDGFINMSSMTAYSNEAGVVILVTRGLVVIDCLDYDDEMQLSLLNITDGVALERINYERPTDGATN